MKKIVLFEVETYYKNGETSSEVISATNEKTMWKIYDEIHSDEVEKIEDSAIVDSWIQ